ncbi:MAG: hypothetical protein H6822_01360 [Planctomycetaceae bacterium]|nr:hypothetical protein [Planctomycetales bacterium]MCB9920794.1 hypothetical protein [Planctomycetaceae bacterium]
MKEASAERSKGISPFPDPLQVAGNFSTDDEGQLSTTLTKDEFGIDANSGGEGNDWFITEYDARPKGSDDSTYGDWTYHSEWDSKNHEDSSIESNGSSEFTLELSKPTGGEISGSIDLEFDGGSDDEWHIDNESNSKYQDSYDAGYGWTQLHKSESKSTYKLDDVYGSSYNGHPNIGFGGDGAATPSGSTHSEENYTFDQVSETKDKWSDETSSAGGYEGYSWSEWDLYENEFRYKTTDHYEAEMSSDTSAGDSPGLPTGSDDGYTDYETFDKTCHSWNYNGTAGGPDCNESTWTTHEDWPSAVDEYLAMLQYEADMEAAAAETDSSADTVVETYNEETGEYTYEVTPNVAGQFFETPQPLPWWAELLGVMCEPDATDFLSPLGMASKPAKPVLRPILKPILDGAGGTIGRLLPKAPLGAIEMHHLLPKQFKSFFSRAGLDIEDFKVPIDRAAASQINCPR